MLLWGFNTHIRCFYISLTRLTLFYVTTDEDSKCTSVFVMYILLRRLKKNVFKNDSSTLFQQFIFIFFLFNRVYKKKINSILPDKMRQVMFYYSALAKIKITKC